MIRKRCLVQVLILQLFDKAEFLVGERFPQVRYREEATGS